MKLAIDHGGACPEQPLSVSGDRTNGTLPADFLRRRSPCDGHPVDGVVALDKDETSTDGKFCGPRARVRNCGELCGGTTRRWNREHLSVSGEVRRRAINHDIVNPAGHGGD